MYLKRSLHRKGYLLDLSVRLFNQVGLGDRANKNRLIEKYVRRTEDDFFCTIQIKVIYSDNLFSVLESLLGHTSRPHEIARLAFAESFLLIWTKSVGLKGCKYYLPTLWQSIF